MQYLFEYSDTLNSPYEAFLYDTAVMTFPIRAHWHYFMEVVYMKDGTGLIECDGKSYVVEPGDLILFHPESVHAIYTATNYSLQYEVLKFDVNKLYTENSYAPKLRIILESASKNTNAPIRTIRRLLYDEEEVVRKAAEKTLKIILKGSK